MPLAATSSLRRLGRPPVEGATSVARLILAGVALVAFASLSRGSAGDGGSSRVVNDLDRVLPGPPLQVEHATARRDDTRATRRAGTMARPVPAAVARLAAIGAPEPVARLIRSPGRMLPGPSPAATARRAMPLVVPSQWTIDAGRFAGLRIDLDWRAATAAPRLRRGSPFWRVARDRTGRVSAAGWVSDSLPVSLVLARTPASVAVPSRDSIRIWAIIRELETEIGRSLFRPADERELGDDRDVVIVRLGHGLGRSAGRTSVSYDSRGRLLDAVIVIGSREHLLDGQVLKHELVHALGFGHASEPSSLMGVGPETASLSALEVARIQVWLALRAEQERSGAALAWPSVDSPR